MDSGRPAGAEVDNGQQIALVSAAWSDQVAEWLGPALWDEFYDLDDLQRDVRAGAVGVFLCMDQGRALGAVALRVDPPQLVVQGIGGRFGTAERMMAFHDALEDLAWYHKCSSIRWHVQRAGLINTAQKHGYEISEVVVRKRL